MEGPLVFVDDLDAPEIADNDRHHLERVLRLAPGEDVTASDGAGRWRPCRFGPRLEATGEIVVEAAPDPPLAIGFALIKGERPELVVQKLTELGVDRIIPFTAARSVVQWDPRRAGRHMTRLRAVARAAAMQCKRSWLPEVEDLCGFGDLVDRQGVALADPSGSAPSLAHSTLLIGPEGGWADEERATGLPGVRLGVHVLRSETAAITAGALLAALRARLV